VIIWPLSKRFAMTVAANPVFTETRPAVTGPSISAVDRLSFTVFLAVVVHAALILGVTFTFAEKSPSTHTMEVTLAQHMSERQPDKVDFIAQFNQAGSGTLADKAELTAPTEADFHDTQIRETSPQARTPAAPKLEQSRSTVVTTTARVASKSNIKPLFDSPSPEISPDTPPKTLLQRSLEIASLEARLDAQRQEYAKRPRIKRLTSLATAASVDAFYLNSWRRKIEKIGNLNYPAEARRNKLFGSLRLLVSILPDGNLKAVSLLESSGHPVLDQAAIDIVKLAAPFAPFSDELRQTTDELEIIRTWQFRKNSSLRSF
jgi:periplasmic protein TonB